MRAQRGMTLLEVVLATALLSASAAVALPMLAAGRRAAGARFELDAIASLIERADRVIATDPAEAGSPLAFAADSPDAAPTDLYVCDPLVPGAPRAAIFRQGGLVVLRFVSSDRASGGTK